MGMAKSVLVTGSTGFIGRATVASLEQDGWVVTRCVCSDTRAIEDGEIYFDLKNPAAILALESNARFDAFVHLGANLGMSGGRESGMFAPNILATGCLAFFANQWNARLVFASTAIFCGIKSERIDTSTLFSPDTAYARSKWLGE